MNQRFQSPDKYAEFSTGYQVDKSKVTDKTRTDANDLAESMAQRGSKENPIRTNDSGQGLGAYVIRIKGVNWGTPVRFRIDGVKATDTEPLAEAGGLDPEMFIWLENGEIIVSNTAPNPDTSSETEDYVPPTPATPPTDAAQKTDTPLGNADNTDAAGTVDATPSGDDATNAAGQPGSQPDRTATPQQQVTTNPTAEPPTESDDSAPEADPNVPDFAKEITTQVSSPSIIVTVGRNMQKNWTFKTAAGTEVSTQSFVPETQASDGKLSLVATSTADTSKTYTFTIDIE